MSEARQPEQRTPVVGIRLSDFAAGAAAGSLIGATHGPAWSFAAFLVAVAVFCVATVKEWSNVGR